VFWSFALFLFFFLLSLAGAQVPPIQPPRLPEPTGRSGEPPTLPQELKPPTPPARTLLPPAPLAPRGEPLPALRVFVRDIKVIGSTVFSEEQLNSIVAPYVNREDTSEDLETLRVALTLLYVNSGYVNSGAILPDQTVTDGVITYQIIEGKLTAVEVEGNKWFRSSYFQKRFNLAAGPPLNINALQQRLQLLLEDSRIQRLNANLKPGVRPGEGILDVRVEESTPYSLYLEYDNYQSPSVGENRGLITLEHRNLTGNGDIAMAQYGGSNGLKPLLDFKYSFPFTAYDTTASYEYRKNTLDVIEAPFQDLNIQSKSDIYTLMLRQPVYRTVNTEIALDLVGERLSDKTELLGERFSLEPGAHNGRSVVSAIRTIQEFVYRNPNQVIAARSRFSFGINALGATVNHNGLPDGIFFAWLGQFQYVRRLGFLDSYVIFRTDVQHSDSPLLSLEQVSIGGRYSVRGYRENTLLRDRAVITSVETRVPLMQNASIRNTFLPDFMVDYIELAPFFDFGRGWNTNLPTPDPKDISSVGVGLRWQLTFPGRVPVRPQFEVYWGHRFRNVPNPRNSLQDNGVHMQFILGVF
jgi:hemolysin activation/secretion protein